MNVIFLDFDGVTNTIHFVSDEDIERRIKLLGEICNEFDCKIVIASSAKDVVNEETLETDSEWVNFIFSCFKKYNIECVGRTPTIGKMINQNFIDVWKEDEILTYLENHPEIEHYCVIADDDTTVLYGVSDLDKVRDHLVETIIYSKDPSEEGLLEKHKPEIKKILELENTKKTRLR
jgi:hypothetical protein